MRERQGGGFAYLVYNYSLLGASGASNEFFHSGERRAWQDLQEGIWMRAPVFLLNRRTLRTPRGRMLWLGSEFFFLSLCDLRVLLFKTPEAKFIPEASTLQSSFTSVWRAVSNGIRSKTALRGLDPTLPIPAHPRWIAFCSSTSHRGSSGSNHWKVLCDPI